MKPQPDAGYFMGSKIRELARKRPELCDSSGRGFWPVPAFFPKLLSHTLNILQDKITELYLSNHDQAEELTEIRISLMKIVYEGDLGENHTGLFVKDHPTITENIKEFRKLPFFNFCSSILIIRNPLILLGILTRNEEGSLEEAKALVETNLISKGTFSKTHLIEEKQHVQISEYIRNKLMQHELWREDFMKGIKLHDKLYSTIV